MHHVVSKTGAFLRTNHSHVNHSVVRILRVTLAAFLFAAPAAAQEVGSVQYGNVYVSVGGGVARLDLPDVEFVQVTKGDFTGFTGKIKNSSDFFDEYGPAINGSISGPITSDVSLSLNGFYANIDDNDRATCTQTVASGCVIFNIVNQPGGFSNGQAGVGNSFISTADRDVDYWGLSLEGKRQLSGRAILEGSASASNARYLALGADIRGIDQDLDLRILSTGSGAQIRYDETLETHYYGMYAAWGGDFSLFPRLTSSLGLQSSFMLRGGLYYGDTDFSGATSGEVSILRGSLNLSDSEAVFIGGVTLETRKQIGKRTMISLTGEYEYYSYVPDVRYNTYDDTGVLGSTGRPTSLGSDDAFSTKTMVRLTVKLGPEVVFNDSLK